MKSLKWFTGMGLVFLDDCTMSDPGNLDGAKLGLAVMGMSAGGRGGSLSFSVRCCHGSFVTSYTLVAPGGSWRSAVGEVVGLVVADWSGRHVLQSNLQNDQIEEQVGCLLLLAESWTNVSK